MALPFSGISNDELVPREYYQYRGTTRAPKGKLDGLTQICNVLFLGVSKYGTLAVVPATSISKAKIYHLVSPNTLHPLPDNSGGVS